MRYINKGEKFSGKKTTANVADMDISGDNATIQQCDVETTFLFEGHKELKSAGKSAVCEIKFDFGGTTLPQVLELATEMVIIKWRAQNKTLSIKALEEFLDNEPEVSVKALLAKGRRKVSNVEKGERLASEMTDAEKLALIEALRASVEGE